MRLFCIPPTLPPHSVITRIIVPSLCLSLFLLFTMLLAPSRPDEFGASADGSLLPGHHCHVYPLLSGIDLGIGHLLGGGGGPFGLGYFSCKSQSEFLFPINGHNTRKIQRNFFCFLCRHCPWTISGRLPIEYHLQFILTITVISQHLHPAALLRLFFLRFLKSHNVKSRIFSYPAIFG